MSINNKQWLGLPLNLLWGYIAIAVFMTGDGFELAFLSHYIKALGFSPAEASFAFTLYGLAAALSAWISGVVAEIITPLKTMMIGFVLWCVFHVLFLVFGLGHANYALILLFYGIRGFAYPLFLYSFIVAIVHNVKSDNASSAIGWFWAVYSIGIGVFGSYIPSFHHSAYWRNGDPVAGAGLLRHRGVIALASLRHIQTPQHMQNLTTREKFSELGRAATLLYTNRNILLSSMVRIINTLSLFGFAVIMPMMFVDELGFTTSEWLQVWAVFFFTTIFSNVLWGILGKNWAG
jgi:polyol permease family